MHQLKAHCQDASDGHQHCADPEEPVLVAAHGLTILKCRLIEFQIGNRISSVPPAEGAFVANQPVGFEKAEEKLQNSEWLAVYELDKPTFVLHDQILASEEPGYAAPDYLSLQFYRDAPDVGHCDLSYEIGDARHLEGSPETVCQSEHPPDSGKQDAEPKSRDPVETWAGPRSPSYVA